MQPMRREAPYLRGIRTQRWRNDKQIDLLED
jgi:hypothetical protein